MLPNYSELLFGGGSSLPSMSMSKPAPVDSTFEELPQPEVMRPTP